MLIANVMPFISYWVCQFSCLPIEFYELKQFARSLSRISETRYSQLLWDLTPWLALCELLRYSSLALYLTMSSVSSILLSRLFMSLRREDRRVLRGPNKSTWESSDVLTYPMVFGNITAELEYGNDEEYWTYSKARKLVSSLRTEIAGRTIDIRLPQIIDSPM